MLRRISILFALLIFGVQPTYASAPKEGAIQFEIPIELGASKYLEMLAYPAYIVVALENNGIKTSNMGRPTLIDERTVMLKNAMLHFNEKKGAVYLYKGSLEWDIPMKHLKFEVPVEIDTSSATNGNIQVSVFLPFASLFPNVLVERIRLKIQALTVPTVQKQLLEYFDALSKKAEPKSGLQGLYSIIMLQSYGVPADGGVVCATHEPGDAESLSDQAYLLATLFIWLIIVPGTIVVFVIWRKYRAKVKR